MTVSKGVGKKSGSADWSSGEGVLPGRAVLGPLLLMITTPCFSIIFFYVCTEMQGSFVAFAQKCFDSGGIVQVLRDIWPDPWDETTWKMILAFMAFELALMKLVPGRRFEGTLTPQGNRPIYTANGVACYVITIATLLLLAHYHLFDPATVYDKFGNILSSMNVFAMCFCCMLLVKGYVAPSSSDSGTTGNIVQDFFWVRYKITTSILPMK
jgi:7-dehydrocholesterol reductase